jgi:hypothetical protein
MSKNPDESRDAVALLDRLARDIAAEEASCRWRVAGLLRVTHEVTESHRNRAATAKWGGQARDVLDLCQVIDHLAEAVALMHGLPWPPEPRDD